MNRRFFLSVAAVVGAAPRTEAQPANLPRIGYLSGRSYGTDVHLLQAFREGLKSAGYVDGQNVTVDVRWADGRYDQVPSMMTELVKTKPDIIVAVGGNPVGLAAKAATSTIPVVFSVGADPVQLGLIGNLSRPEGNLTGITLYAAQLDAKRLDLLGELLPKARKVAVLINPTNPGGTMEASGMQDAAVALKMTLDIKYASSSKEIERAFEELPSGSVDALAVAADAFLINQRRKIMALAALRDLPAIYPSREFPDDGGLASYGTRWAEMYRIVGTQTARILKGAKPADLPVQRPTTYELVVNQRTAKALGLTLPPLILARADEVLD